MMRGKIPFGGLYQNFLNYSTLGKRMGQKQGIQQQRGHPAQKRQLLFGRHSACEEGFRRQKAEKGRFRDHRIRGGNGLFPQDGLQVSAHSEPDAAEGGFRQIERGALSSFGGAVQEIQGRHAQKDEFEFRPRVLS